MYGTLLQQDQQLKVGIVLSVFSPIVIVGCTSSDTIFVGSPSGHVMATVSVMLCMVLSFNKINNSR